MRIDFQKMHGAGNDFVMIDGFTREFDLAPHQVQRICDRHFGIGGDGVIVVQRPKTVDTDGYMHYFNADGTLAEMCGNGVRCAAKYLVDNELAGGDGHVTVGTLGGVKPIEYRVGINGVEYATVNMGKPILTPEVIPIAAHADALTANGQPYVRDHIIKTPWGSVTFAAVSMGNPHAIWFLPELDTLPEELFPDGGERALATMDISRIGPYLEKHPDFPQRTNIELAVVKNHSEVHIRVWERGVGETLACGTGACAVAVASVLTEQTSRKADVHLPGGVLNIEWAESGEVLLGGPVALTYTGEIELA